MSKLCFNISSPAEPAKPIFPRWFQVGLYLFIMWSCGMMMLNKFLGTGL